VSQAEHPATAPLAFATDHPAFAGHFPGAPLLPGALLLDEILQRLPIRDAGPRNAPLQLTAVKFRRPVGPGTRLQLRFETREDGAVSFCASDAHGAVIDGVARQA
jgi:3-hydroxymyristoyl/3-hydroxydecanoyl-(acyl carrier protein) dehydratase